MKIPEIPKLPAYRLGTALVMGAVIGASVPGFTIAGGAALVATAQAVSHISELIHRYYAFKWTDFRYPILCSVTVITKASFIYSVHRLAALSISLFPAYMVTSIAVLNAAFWGERLCYYFHPELKPIENPRRA